MKKGVLFSLFALAVALLLSSCEFGGEPTGNIVGRWQNVENTKWYRVFTDEVVTDDLTYKWGKEWNEDEDVTEADVNREKYGNGWFKWRQTNAELLEIHRMENGWADIPQCNTITSLTDETLVYKTSSGKTYSFKKGAVN